ncbi:LOW QUALITY PROTEIN: zinc transporter ZIP6-like [Paramacrobiotus metropolitanus]|uniref:LOW QUALITY PROTEIN: zinc transporter ZIP6-like n=1 Tax=Paramacrobiotus metropolitanus TaxID=2943436 RepID=UPI0024457107|nr:LOW QUALITY PROTEIN: zinc transporter ZIP6-like [Paramacrobiotus metropolitanus]
MFFINSYKYNIPVVICCCFVQLYSSANCLVTGNDIHADLAKSLGHAGAPRLPQEISSDTPISTSQTGSRILKDTKQASPRQTTVVDSGPEAFAQSLFDVDFGSRLSIEKLADIMQHLEIGNVTNWKQAKENDRKSRSTRQNRPLQKSANGSCWALDELLDIFTIKQSTLTKSEFQRLCPALIQQTYSGVCQMATELNTTENEISRITDAEKYGYGTAAVVIVSLLSVAGICLIPLLKRQIYYYAIQGFIALGAGTLCGDAVLHLLPQALRNRQDHGSASSHVKSDDDVSDSSISVWRGVACLGAIYVFFLWEMSLHYFISRRRGHRTSGAQDPTVANGKELQHDHSHYRIQVLLQRLTRSPAKILPRKRNCNHRNLLTENQAHVQPNSTGSIPITSTDLWDILGITPLAWMILLGDCIHNFGDGLTIAAAFSLDVRSGISTSIAIFCHEVPHELGDFAILLNTGMSFKLALVLNLVSAVTCLIGFYIGIPVASYDSARQWIFVIAAGMFLYVALADMLPELKHGASNIPILVAQNLGLIVGAGIMTVMALYEESIQI